jgi:predicted nicotinamide N-methyase
MPEQDRTTLVFQDFVQAWVGRQRAAGGGGGDGSDGSDGDDLESRLFELANAPAVAYRCIGGQHVTVQQDREAKVHTGGIVWETAFLLALFLEPQWPQPRPRHVLEVGAGCGLLGMVLAAAGSDVVLSEHPIALANLQRNVAACSAVAPERARVARLDWTEQGDVRALAAAQLARGCPPCFDTIVGTDVVFSEHLVVPLLDTIHTLADAHTTVWLCLQERCAASHKLLLATIPHYFRDCARIEPAAPAPAEAAHGGCSARLGPDVATVIEALHGQLECVLLKLTGRLQRAAAGAAGPLATQHGQERQPERPPAKKEAPPCKSGQAAAAESAAREKPRGQGKARRREREHNQTLGAQKPRKKHKKSREKHKKSIS